jgi:hypothetical protein
MPKVKCRLLECDCAGERDVLRHVAVDTFGTFAIKQDGHAAVVRSVVFEKRQKALCEPRRKDTIFLVNYRAPARVDPIA